MVEDVVYRAFLHAPHDSTTTGEGSKKEEKGGQENTRSVKMVTGSERGIA